MLEYEIPKNIKEAISFLDKTLLDDDKKYLLEFGPLSVHFSLGRWIRNEWGLWKDDESELKNELISLGFNHPDDMSNYIIEEYIKSIKQ